MTRKGLWQLKASGFPPEGNFELNQVGLTYTKHTEYQKTQSADANCWYCLQEGRTPQVPVIAVANKTYLALPATIQMVPGHCLIIPAQHVLTSLECEDDVWDEIRVSLYSHERHDFMSF